MGVMVEILVREAVGAEDVAVVRRLLQAYGEHLASTPANICIEGYERELQGLPSPYAALLLAFVDEAAAGCVALKRIHVAGEQACEIKRLWVEAGFRGLGLGRRLVEEAIGWAERRGYGAMYLDTVLTAMPEATMLYRAMGFVQVERYNENSVPNVVFFRRELESRT